jgi:26S proteasome regulatory subunit N1
LELLQERLKDPDHAQRIFALSEIKKEVSGATQSMTSVPKPLKFLVKHYAALKEIYHGTPSSNFKVN